MDYGGLESKQGDLSEAPAEVQARDHGELDYGPVSGGGRRRRLREYGESRGDQNDSKTVTVLRFSMSPGSHILGDLPVVTERWQSARFWKNGREH